MLTKELGHKKIHTVNFHLHKFQKHPNKYDVRNQADGCLWGGLGGNDCEGA